MGGYWEKGGGKGQRTVTENFPCARQHAAILASKLIRSSNVLLKDKCHMG